MSKEQDIVEGNKIIAVFMEFDYERTLKWIENEDRPLNKSGRLHKMEVPLMVDDLQYHSSWDWLMPAVKKWNDLVISKRTEGKPGWMKWQYQTVMLRTEIVPVFNDLVTAIQWYQKQKE